MKILKGAFVIGLSVISSQLHSQSTTAYTYDAEGRLVAVRDGTGFKSDYVLDKADNRSSVATKSQFSTAWNGASLSHGIGGTTIGTAWRSAPINGSGYMIYGPYTTQVPAGQRVATFQIMIDASSAADNTNIVAIDVFDATAGQFLGQLYIPRSTWMASSSYQVFELPFTMATGSVGHSLEMRVWTNGQRTVTVGKIGYY